MIELVFIRHGETDSNIERRYLGWTNIELNETGITQAKEAVKKLQDNEFDSIYSSPLKRTLKTAQIINKERDLNIICDDRLKERNFGVMDNFTYKEILKTYPNESKLWREDWINYKIKEGESAYETFNRNKQFIDGILSKKNGGKYMIITHLGCIRNMLAYLLNMDIEGLWRFRLDNCSINRVEITDGYAVLTKLNG